VLLASGRVRKSGRRRMRHRKGSGVGWVTGRTRRRGEEGGGRVSAAPARHNWPPGRSQAETAGTQWDLLLPT
jgi:hypothetical protein